MHLQDIIIILNSKHFITIKLSKAMAVLFKLKCDRKREQFLLSPLRNLRSSKN